MAASSCWCGLAIAVVLSERPNLINIKPMIALNRRWFRFSLRTLFVVVTIAGLLAGWVAYQLNWIRQRNEVIIGGDWDTDPTVLNLPVPIRGKWDYPPWTLGWFGEVGIGTMYLSFPPDTSDDELRGSNACFLKPQSNGSEFQSENDSRPVQYLHHYRKRQWISWIDGPR